MQRSSKNFLNSKSRAVLFLFNSSFKNVDLIELDQIGRTDAGLFSIVLPVHL